MWHPVVDVEEEKHTQALDCCSVTEDTAVLHNQHLRRDFHTYLVCSNDFNPGVVHLEWELCDHSETLLRGWFVGTFPN